MNTDEISHFLSATLLCFYFYPETLTQVYMCCPPLPVFPCQQPARRGDSQLWLRQNEYTWDVSSLTWSTPNVNTYAVQWLTSRRQASPDDAPAWACVGSSGRSLSTHSGPVLLHPAALNAFICFTSALPNYQRQTVLKPNQIWDRLPRGDAKYISLTLKAKHCDTEPSADINVNHGAPLYPRMSTFAHAIWSKRHLLTLLQAPGCRGSYGRKWPTADGLSIPWAPGASINHQNRSWLSLPERMTFPRHLSF